MVGLINHVGLFHEVQMSLSIWKGAILRGNRQTTVKYRHNPRSSVQTRLNRSRCRLCCGLGWAQSIMCYMTVQIPHLKGQFWWMGTPTVNYRHFLPSAVLKRLNRSICRLGCGLEWAEGCTNSIVFARWRQHALVGDMLPPPVE